MENDQDYDDNDDELYQSLADLSMDQSPSLDDSREDLAAATLTCNEEGNFGLVLRHFTVIANVPVSNVTHYTLPYVGLSPSHPSLTLTLSLSLSLSLV